MAGQRLLTDDSPSLPDDAELEKPSGPGWRRRKQHRRGEILDAAIRQIEAIGPEDLLVTDIARSAGVSEATVYYYFKTRNALICAALSNALERTYLKLEEDLSSRHDFSENLYNVISQVMHSIVRHPQIYKANTLPIRWSREYQELVKPVNDRFRTLLHGIFDEGIATGELNADFSKIVASDMIIGSITHFGWRAVDLTDCVREDVDALAGSITMQLLAGIRSLPR